MRHSTTLLLIFGVLLCCCHELLIETERRRAYFSALHVCKSKHFELFCFEISRVYAAWKDAFVYLCGRIIQLPATAMTITEVLTGCYTSKAEEQ